MNWGWRRFEFRLGACGGFGNAVEFPRARCWDEFGLTVPVQREGEREVMWMEAQGMR